MRQGTGTVVSQMDSREDVSVLLGSSPPNPVETPGMSLKILYYLISTLNMIFPDYDFSELKPEAFHLHPNLSTIVSHVNTTLFNTGVNKNLTSFGEFSSKLWERIDMAIGLRDCEIYSFTNDKFDVEDEDPFWERGCMY